MAFRKIIVSCVFFVACSIFSTQDSHACCSNPNGDYPLTWEEKKSDPLVSEYLWNDNTPFLFESQLEEYVLKRQQKVMFSINSVLPRAGGYTTEAHVEFALDARNPFSGKALGRMRIVPNLESIYQIDKKPLISIYHTGSMCSTWMMFEYNYNNGQPTLRVTSVTIGEKKHFKPLLASLRDMVGHKTACKYIEFANPSETVISLLAKEGATKNDQDLYVIKAVPSSGGSPEYRFGE